MGDGPQRDGKLARYNGLEALGFVRLVRPRQPSSSWVRARRQESRDVYGEPYEDGGIRYILDYRVDSDELIGVDLRRVRSRRRLLERARDTGRAAGAAWLGPLRSTQDEELDAVFAIYVPVYGTEEGAGDHPSPARRAHWMGRDGGPGIAIPRHRE
ncbi:MAG: CHASE domain-containing protein [Egibacteraceae bacterium]